jgi:IS6 family transposase
VTKLRPVEFKWRQFEPQLILMAVGWYLRFSLSYRDVEELMQERGMSADHVTVWRWVQRYAPELDRRLRSHLKPTNKAVLQLLRNSFRDPLVSGAYAAGFSSIGTSL